jgi:hypothetical protein
MDVEIQLQFFQTAASVLPSIFIAFVITSHILDPTTQQNLKIDFFFLSGKSGIVTLVVVIAGFIAAELLTFVILATNTPTLPAFFMVIFFAFLFVWFIGLKSLNPIFQNAVAVAEENTSGDEAKAIVIDSYRRFGNVMIVGSLALPVIIPTAFFLTGLPG